MKTKIEIKSVFGKILFEYTKENNTIKDTLIEATRNDINLCDVDLHDANLYGIDLSSVDLRNANLCNANLCNAELCNTKLCSADLHGANLCDTNLRDANLYDVNFRGATLRSAILREANLHNANLHSANLFNADLCNANLNNTDLCNANLNSAEFHNTNLYNVNLHNADLCNVKHIPFIPTYLPEGEFIAWKKLSNSIIVKLKILEDSKRSRATGDKCRCDKALVIEFQNLDGTKSEIKEYTNSNYATCKYKVGKIVKANGWDRDRFNECSHGIHFFVDRQSAVNYMNHWV